jgi:cytochrome c oxidase subunit 4
MKPDRPATYVRTWIALLVLLAATCASSFVPMGPWNLALNLAIAAAKALLVAFVFMRLRRERAMVGLVAAAGVVWLSLLVGLSAFDFAARFG